MPRPRFHLLHARRLDARGQFNPFRRDRTTSNADVIAKAIKAATTTAPYSSATFAVLTLPPSPPLITSIRLSATTLTISATNGSFNGTYYLLMSTNLTTPLSQWKRVLTNTFDGGGNLNLSTNIVNPGDAQEFYSLQVQ